MPGPDPQPQWHDDLWDDPEFVELYDEDVRAEREGRLGVGVDREGFLARYPALKSHLR